MGKRLFAIGCAIAAAGICCTACDGGDSKGCTKSSDCGDTGVWRCDVASNECVLLVPEHCTDGKKSGDETDADCGGSCSEKCAIGAGCGSAGDCASGYCGDGGLCEEEKCDETHPCPDGRVCGTEGVCISCDDGIRNGDETDVDCGGTCGATCTDGRTCAGNDDCISGECEAGHCRGSEAMAANLSDLVINEVMGAPKSGANFAIQTDTAQCEFVEIVNKGTHAYSLDGIRLKFRRLDTGAETEMALSGTIPAGNAAVFAENEIDVPAGVLMVPGKITSKGITNSADYDIWLTDGSAESGHVLRAALKSATGVSQNRATDANDNEDELVFHNTLGFGLDNSPGYCANGGTFAKSCADGKPKDDPGEQGDGGESGDDPGEQDGESGDNPGEQDGGTTPTYVLPDLGVLVINEVFGSPDTKSTFDDSTTTQCEFVEIVNTSDDVIDADGLALNWKRDGKETITTCALEGTIPAKGAFVVSGCDGIDVLPQDAGHYKCKSLNNSGSASIVNSAKYEFWLSTDEDDGDRIVREGSSAKGIGQTRNPDITGTTLVVANTVPGLLPHSPGFCSNGGTFSKSCADGRQIQPADGNDGDPQDGEEPQPGGEETPADGNGTCQQESDCGNGYVCQFGQCAKICEDDGGCNTGYHCNTVMKVCAEDDEDWRTQDKGERCTSDSQCKDGLFCLGGICDKETTCEYNKDCAKGYLCNTSWGICEKGVDDGQAQGGGSSDDPQDVEGACYAPREGDLFISEILNKASTGMTFPDSETKVFEFVELHNASGHNIDLTSLQIKFERTDKSGTAINLSLAEAPSCLAANAYAVVMPAAATFPTEYADISPVLIGVKGLGDNGDSKLTDSATFNVSLNEMAGRTVSASIHKVALPKVDDKAVSAALPESGAEKDDNGIDMLVSHKTLSDAETASSIGRANE